MASSANSNPVPKQYKSVTEDLINAIASVYIVLELCTKWKTCFYPFGWVVALYFFLLWQES
uniref:Uncharacterized protein n=1 Tax=Sphaeramia orbicularis TaxID=375764 RepID=A0A673B5J3_9TELE